MENTTDVVRVLKRRFLKESGVDVEKSSLEDLFAQRF
jgi:peroxiredoxin